MEFLLYLSPASQEIYQMISRKVRVVENAPICRKYSIFGMYETKDRVMTFCTKNIKNFGQVKHYVNETLLHEAVHIAQACKSGGNYVAPFGISIHTMKLTSRRIDDINSAVKISGEDVRQVEREAFWMEDKPDKVRYVVQKYCF